jgi:hypothetical protein
VTIRAEVEGIGTLEFPDGTDPSIVQATVQRVVARGTPKIPEGTKILGRSREQEELPRPNMLEEAGRGFMDIGQGVKQGFLRLTDPAAAKDYTRDVDAEIARYTAGRGKDAPFDAARIGGAILGSVPATAAVATAAPEAVTASLLGRVLLGGTQGAIQGASEYAPEGQSKGAQIAFGTAGGMAGVPVGELMARVAAKVGMAAQRGVTRLTTSPDEIVAALQGELKQAGVDWNSLGAEVKAGLMQQARRQLSATGELSPDQIARKPRWKTCSATAQDRHRRRLRATRSNGVGSATHRSCKASGLRSPSAIRPSSSDCSSVCRARSMSATPQRRPNTRQGRTRSPP